MTDAPSIEQTPIPQTPTAPTPVRPAPVDPRAVGPGSAGAHRAAGWSALPASRAPALWWIERALDRHYAVFTVIVIGLVVADQLADSRDLGSWNWLLVSGFVVWLVALRFGLRLPGKVNQTIVRLADRGVFETTDRTVADFLDAAHRKARRASIAGVLVCVAILAVAWLWFGWTAVNVVGFRAGEVGPLLQPLVWTYLPFLGVELAAAIPVGLFVGRAASYGLLGYRLSHGRFTLRVDPEHLDEVAGLGPIGSLYSYQAMIIAIPAMFVGAWWFLIPLFPQYSAWRSAYAALFAITIVAELLVFLLPMGSIHALMRAERERLLGEADELSVQYVSGWQQVRGRAAETGPTPDQLAAVAARYKAIESMPTWPVDARIRRRLELSNLLLLVPVVAEVVGLTNDWQSLLDKLG